MHIFILDDDMHARLLEKHPHIPHEETNRRFGSTRQSTYTYERITTTLTIQAHSTDIGQETCSDHCGQDMNRVVAVVGLLKKR
jgi:hypothetical protein